ncbi:MAG: DUF4369 domain-containing protein, partial [Sphingobacteriales bacterium]
MKLIIVEFLIIVLMSPTHLLAQQQKGYEINGHMDGLADGEKVVMQLSDGSAWGFIRRDSANVKNGDFHLTGFVPEGPRFYFLTFDKHTTKAIRLTIDNGEHIIIRSTDINLILHDYIERYVTIEGSPTFNAWNWLYYINGFYAQSIYHINNAIIKIKDSIGFDR